MATTATPIFPQTITNSFATIVDTDVSGLKTVYTAGANGSQLNKITVTNTDPTTSYNLNWWVTNGGTDYLIGQTYISAGAGSPSIPAYDLLLDNISFFTSSLDACGNPQIHLAVGSALRVNCTTTVGTGYTITVFAQGGNF